jgi:hypothetical protein
MVRRSVEQAPRRHLHCLGEPFQRRYLWVSFAGLDPADLSRLHAAPDRHLFLRQFEFLAGSPQVLAEVTHSRDRRA